MSDLASRKNIKSGNLTATNLKNIESNFSSIWNQWSTKLDTSPNGSEALLVDNKINSVYLPDYVLGNVLYGGTINASGVATLTSAFKSKYGITQDTLTITESSAATYEGVYFIVSGDVVDVEIAGVMDMSTGDWLISNGATWDKIDNTDAVRTVNGRTGDITTYKSEWVSGVEYKAGDLVLGSDGILYVVKSDHTSSSTITVTNTTYYVPALSATLTTKLNGIQAGAQVNVIEKVQVAGSDLTITSKTVNIPLANGTTPGVVKNTATKTTTGMTESPVVNGIVYHKEYSTFTTSSAGLVPASGDGSASKYLSADGTFKTITVPTYALGTTQSATNGQIQLTKDGTNTSTVTIEGSGIAKVTSDASGKITVEVNSDDTLGVSDVQITSDDSKWTTIVLDGDTYQAYPLDSGYKVFKVFAQTTVSIAGSSSAQLVQVDAPVVTTGTIDYIIVEAKMAMTARCIVKK